ncbi:phosphatidylglycerophosphatase and protein-tyrosine phosphatase 1 isoform X1 [Mauremys mutica]|uniref:phosphatidylglycerophosphatase and protein-tyrosine phosphatase 1 isoform X1 n=1 Tax=Mauremys mutica TaxID=74926 RepID=UPI001D167D5A|nr:phosphatidylglycerophosphatase and protein-tyrosine phosphatase 1 isoform X1 [Mauremys mutica]
MGVAVALGSGAARLFFYPSLLYTLVRERLPGSQRPWFHRIDRAVLLGALPLRARSRRLVEEENVRGVLTLNEEYETRFLCCSAQLSHSGLKSMCCVSDDHEVFALHAHSLHLPTRQEWEAMGVEQLRLSTVDLTGVPTLENLQRGVKFVLKHRECGNSVYVHCKAGRSRSATMVAAYLIQLYQWSPQEAIEAIARVRPHILVRPRQVQVLERFHRNVIAEAAAESHQELPETIHQLPTTSTSS